MSSETAAPGAERARIAPSRLIRAASTRPLTVLCSDDDRMTDFLVVPIALFYPGRLDEAAVAAGLADVLGRAPIFAGRARSPDGPFDIECDNTGVALSTAEVDLTLPEAVASASAWSAPWLVDMIDPVQVRAARAPLFTVRLSYLADGATALGICVHHSTGDAASLMTVMRAWSAAVEGKPIIDPIVVEDRNAYLDAHIPAGTDRPSLRELRTDPDEPAALRALLVDDAAKAVIRVHFSGAEVDRMQKAISARAGMRVSPVNALCAHLMALITQYDEPGDGEWGICVPSDFRAAAGIDQALIANLISQPWFRFPRCDDPAVLAALLRRAARELASQHIYYHANRRLVASLGGPPALRRLLPCGIDPLRRSLALTDRSGMGLYEIAFGGQTPVYVAFPSRRTLPWTSHLSQAGRRPTGELAPILFTAFLPAALAAQLSTTDARARLHEFRDDADPPPPDPASAIPDLF